MTDRLKTDMRYAIDSIKMQCELKCNQEWMDNVTSGDYLRYYEEMYK